MTVMHRRIRRRFHIQGVVQGVGFRPFVYGRAIEMGVTGYVVNDPRGVAIEAEGDEAAVARFEAALRADPPPLASITSFQTEDIDIADATTFEIRSSRSEGRVRVSIPPDLATCRACAAEVEDVRDRRHRYAFTNCTDCGPRFTIVAASPYDRVNTTMASFEMCRACAAEYSDQGSRRFHAQPIACPECGPRLRLLTAEGGAIEEEAVATEALEGAAELLIQGAIVAIKGLGGFHLACDATNANAVKRLRARKHREAKPLALMVADLAAARELAVITSQEEALLSSPRAPIVLSRRRPSTAVAEEVAPGNPYLGLMLPYTPLHHLLLAAVRRPLVMTSGNLVDEPVAFQDDDAYERLQQVADAFLIHDRPIRTRCDDSVVRAVGSQEYLIRRSRGYVPQPISVPTTFSRPVLATGPELKHTFCLGVEDLAVVSHHIGDLQNYAAMAAFTDGVAHLKRLFDIDEVDVVAYDLHPGYLATRWALSSEAPTKIGVQHHHAHIASCLADNNRSDRVIGLALDGTGMGDDGTLWGCEILVADLTGYERFAHLAPVSLPGGEAAIKEPWRMAAVYLEAGFGDGAYQLALEVVRETGSKWAPILKMARRGLNSPEATSAGRLFDAAAAVCGLRTRSSYEGQAAAELENVADPSSGLVYPFPFSDGRLDGVSLIRALAEDVAAGRSVPEAAAGFHNGLAAGLVETALGARAATGIEVVALSGGTWQNVFLLERVRSALRDRGFEVLLHRQVPCNDGGVSLGQAVVASAKLI